MGQYIDKSNALIRWILVLANFVILVRTGQTIFDIVNLKFFLGFVFISGQCWCLDNWIQVLHIRTVD